jgi:hypothetical protein
MRDAGLGIKDFRRLLRGEADTKTKGGVLRDA